MEDRSLNAQQKKAVEHTTGPLLIIAGAGTGKTTVITERVKHLILDKHVPPTKILALTFTEKAAQEMEERIDIAMPYGYGELWIETFHAFCDRILKQEAIHIGITPDYRLTTEAENVLFLKKNLFKLQLDYFRPLGNPSKFLQGLLNHFSRLKDEDISPEQYMDYAKTLQETPFTGDSEDKDAYEEEVKKTLELAFAYKTYEELKVKEGIMDFADLIAYTLKLLRERKSIAKKYQEMFEYILIDEFQDTNYAQNQLAIILAGKKQNITVVGDDDQAIYRWRGAAVSNMIQFRSNFPNVEIVTLTQNYRSSQLILDTAYKLIQHNNPDRLEVKENINKKLTATGKKSNYVADLILSDRGENEAETVVKKIEELTKTTQGKKAYTYGDIAILVRANDHAQPFIKALEAARIPHQFLGPTQLFHQEEIKDIIAYLKVLANLEDAASFYRVLTIPIFHIHPVTISMILNTAKRRNVSIFELLSSPDTLALQEEEKKKLEHVYEMIRSHLELVSKESTAQIVFAFLQDSGIFQTLLDPKDLLLQLQAQNISKLFEKIKAYESEYNAKTIYETLEWIDLLMQMGESPQAAAIEYMDTNAVNILTVHSSKGLEFPVVFIVNLVRERFPSRQRGEQIPVPQDLIKEVLPEGDYHLEEERRLFYVAVTRAKERLFFSASSFYGEGKREKKLSPFIAESVGEELIEKVKQQTKSSSAQLSLLDLVPQQKAAVFDSAISDKSEYKVTYLSYSQIQTFESCPLHYKLKYILKVPTPQTTSQTFGTSIHAALRDFYQRRIAKTEVKISDIPSILKQVWIHEGYDNKAHEEEAFERAVSVLEDYLTVELASNPNPIALELPFDFYIDRLRIGGRIDRVDELSDGSIEIIDYKTGANVPTEKDVAKNLQLTTYALAAANIQDKMFQRNPNQILLSLYYVEQGKKLTTTRTPEQLEAAKEELLQAAKEIEQSDFSCSKSIFCKNCEYKMLCQTS